MTATDILRETETRMKRGVEAAGQDFATLRTGRANPALLENLRVEYYGQTMPLNQLGSVTVPEARVLLIQAWDKASLQAIEKAITKSDLGLNPSNDGSVIRLNIPPLTTDRRKEFVKQLAGKAENARVSIRNHRRDAIEQFKKDEEVTEDEAKRAEKDVQKLLDKYIAEIDALQKSKESELMEN